MNGVRVIDSYAFDSTDSLESLYFGVHVQRIAANAFNFSGLTSFVVDAEEIETGAFTGCKNLTSLHFTKKVKTIGETFAMECDSLNAPSRKAAERLGFRFEGIFRQAVVYKGRSRDTA